MKTLIRLLLQDQSVCPDLSVIELGVITVITEVKQTDRGQGFTKPLVLSTFQTMRVLDSPQLLVSIHKYNQ